MRKEIFRKPTAFFGIIGGHGRELKGKGGMIRDTREPVDD